MVTWLHTSQDSVLREYLCLFLRETLFCTAVFSFFKLRITVKYYTEVSGLTIVKLGETLGQKQCFQICFHLGGESLGTSSPFIFHRQDNTWWKFLSLLAFNGTQLCVPKLYWCLCLCMICHIHKSGTMLKIIGTSFKNIINNVQNVCNSPILPISIKLLK